MSFKSLHEKQIQNLEEFQSTVRGWLKQLRPGDVLLLQGDLAAGKTEAVKQLAALYGLAEANSPTFALHQRYQNQKMTIDHWDLYRLQGEDELESSGFWDQFAAKNAIVAIEWSERLQYEWLPLDWRCFRLCIKVQGNLRHLLFEVKN